MKKTDIKRYIEHNHVHLSIFIGLWMIGLFPEMVLSRPIDSPAVYYDDLTWSWKSWVNGIEGLWDRDGHVSTMMAQQGHSVACKWIEREVRCVFVWEKE